MNDARIIVALDFPESRPAIALADRLDPSVCKLKVGLELFVSEGPAIVEMLTGKGFDVFLDLKFHDIPNTVAQACRAAAATGAWMINIHALGGQRMMAAAREAIDGCDHKPLLIGVTILTSHADEELAQIGLTGTTSEMVSCLASQVRDCGLDGVVCSPHEASALRNQAGDGFVLVTPGVRPVGADVADQRRVMTPREALTAGASYLVIGRPITGASDPAIRASEIAEDCAGI
ncbi:MAG: orotidine-5'-phosphate decarboxylase [Gammaproteobacteria bacterium]|nr:orotidine-5'-phosphate decarboxylase [Gammaproteobacteria bacterium]